MACPLVPWYSLIMRGISVDHGRRQGLKANHFRIKDVLKTFTGVRERCLSRESVVPFPGLAAFPFLFPVVFPVFPVKNFLPNVLPVMALVGGLKKR